MDRPPAPLSPLVMPLSPPFPLRITTGWASPILSITSPTSSLTAFLCVLRHPQKVLTRSFLKRWLRLRPSWRLLPMNKPVVLSDLDDTLFPCWWTGSWSRLNSYPLPHGELKKSAAYGSLSTPGQSPLTGPSFSRQKANPTRSGRPICSASWLPIRKS